jgi:class 3 adenylate cyclase
MEALAAPGSVFLTGHAARLVQGFLALRELGPHELKSGGVTGLLGWGSTCA